MDQPSIVRPVPRVDPPPEHTCGTTYRAGVATVGCPGCAGRLVAASIVVLPVRRVAR